MSNQNDAEIDDNPLHHYDYAQEHNMNPGNLHQEELMGALVEMMAELVDQYIDLYPDRRPQVTEETIQSFPVLEPKDMPKDSACQICLEEYKDGDNIYELPCKHPFHLNCIKQWLSHRTNCPYCRHELPTDDRMFEQFKKRKMEKQKLEEDIKELHESMFS